MSYRLMVLDSSDIDLADDTFRITLPVTIERLVKSIQHTGLINSPILIQRSDRYVIVAGFQRIAALQQLNIRHIPVKVMPTESSPLQCIRVAITDNNSQRELNLLEISRALALLSGCIEDRVRLSEEAEFLGLPGNYHHIEKIIGIRRLPRLIQEGIRSNRIMLKMVAELQNFDASTGNLLARLFMELKLNQNKQKEICVHLKEIARRENQSIQDVVSSQGILDILEDKEMDNLQKTRIVRSNLRRRRFPNLSLAEETFQRHRQKLNLGNDITLAPPEYFEATSLKLSMTFKNEIEFKRHIEVLNKTLTNPSLSKLFR